MARYGSERKRPPLDADGLDQLALAYVARYATSRAKLLRYLARKLRERGWDGDREPDLDAIADRLADLRYIDDRAYALMKGSAMERRGLGARRIEQALLADGLDGNERAEATDHARAGRWAAAETFARRKRLGPYGASPPDPALREKQIAAFLRAGHDFATARAWVDAAPGEVPEMTE